MFHSSVSARTLAKTIFALQSHRETFEVETFYLFCHCNLSPSVRIKNFSLKDLPKCLLCAFTSSFRGIKENFHVKALLSRGKGHLLKISAKLLMERNESFS